MLPTRAIREKERGATPRWAGAVCANMVTERWIMSQQRFDGDAAHASVVVAFKRADCTRLMNTLNQIWQESPHQAPSRLAQSFIKLQYISYMMLRPNKFVHVEVAVPVAQLELHNISFSSITPRANGGKYICCSISERIGLRTVYVAQCSYNDQYSVLQVTVPLRALKALISYCDQHVIAQTKLYNCAPAILRVSPPKDGVWCWYLSIECLHVLGLLNGINACTNNADAVYHLLLTLHARRTFHLAEESEPVYQDVPVYENIIGRTEKRRRRNVKN